MLYNDETNVSRLLYPGSSDSEMNHNRLLLCDYDYDRYVEGLTGFAGQNLQRIFQIRSVPAVRSRVGERGNYKSAVTVLPDKRLICVTCVPRINNAETEFYLHVYESQDYGNSWVSIGNTEMMGKEPSIIAYPDGTLVMTAQSITDGKMGYSLPIYRSFDSGRNWEYNCLDGNRDYPRSLFLDKDGSLCFIRCAGIKYEFETNTDCNGDARMEICRSYDYGKTFQKSYGSFDNWDYPGFMEISSIRLTDGSLLAALRHQPSGTKGECFENTLLTHSYDNGLTWSTPKCISHTGEVHFHLLLLNDNSILGTYSNYHLPYGVCAVRSYDNGQNWDYDNIYQLAISADYYTGWGSTVSLYDNQLLTCYASTCYLGEDHSTTVCESIRWNL